jgi:hypothetical protein
LTLALAGSANWPANSIYDVFVTLNAGVPVLGTRAWDASMLPTGPTLITPSTSNTCGGAACYITTGTGATAWTRPSAAFNGTPSQNNAASAFNGTPSNTGTLANCLGQDWGSGVTNILSQVVVTAPTDVSLDGGAATSFQIATQGSNDNTNWQILDIRNINASANGTVYTIPINAAYQIAYRYDRECFTSDAGANIHVAQIQFYNTTPPSTRRIAPYNGIPTNDATITTLRTGASTTLSNVPVNQATWLGTIQTDAGTAGQVTAYVNTGASRAYNIWNAQNQRNIVQRASIPCVTTTFNCNYNLSSPTNIDWGPVQSSTTFSQTVLIGLAQDPVTCIFPRTAYLNTSSATGTGMGYESGIGIDSTHGFSGSEGDVTLDTTGQNMGLFMQATVTLPPFFGTHTMYGVEKMAYAPATGGIAQLFADFRNTSLICSWRG